MDTITLQQRSPFKFLDSYTKNDKNIFFGRDEEIKAIYELVQVSKLVLIYGASGTGKTSLIECGLSNKFSEADWFDVRIRRGNVPFLEATIQAVKRKLNEEINIDRPLVDSVQSLYYNNFIPIYLIFDQFEELFIMGDEKERIDFFNALADLVHLKVPCKILLIVREEYLAYFHDFEKIISIIYDNRFRIERMNQDKLEKVIKGTIQTPQYDIQFNDPDANTQLIIENLRNDRYEVDLTNLQVYLDRLYKVDLQRGEQNHELRPPFNFDKVLIEKVGKLPQVISLFLDEQVTDIDKTIDYNNATLTILKLFVTDEGTKKSRSLNGIIDEFEKNKILPIPVVNRCVVELYERRILKELVIGDELRYEILHDLLAGQVFERFSMEEKEFIRAERMIRDGYEFHNNLLLKGLNGSFLKEEQIFFIQNLKKVLDITLEEQDYLTESISNVEAEHSREKRMLEQEVAFQKQKVEQEENAKKIIQLELLEKEKQEYERQKVEGVKEQKRQFLEIKRQKFRFVIAIALGVVMLVLLLYSINQKIKTAFERNQYLVLSQKYSLQKEELKELLQKNEQHSKILKQKEYDYLIAQSETYRTKKEFTATLSALESAKRIDSSKRQMINSMIVFILMEEKENNLQLRLQNEFDSLLRLSSNILHGENAINGKLLKPEEYNNAYNCLIKNRIVLSKMKSKNDSNIKLLNDKFKETTITLFRAFEAYKNKAERFQKANGWKEAIMNYEKALALETIDFNNKEKVKRLIEECKDNQERSDQKKKSY
jgi:hypothetical protein